MSNSAAFRIEEFALGVLNEGGNLRWAVETARRVLDRCLREGTPIVVIDAHGREIGRVTERDGDRYVWKCMR